MHHHQGMKKSELFCFVFCFFVLFFFQGVKGGHVHESLHTDMLDLSSLQESAIESSLELGGDRELKRVGISSLADNNVDLIGERGDDLGPVAQGCLKINGDTRGLVNHDSGGGSIHLDLDAITVGDLEGSNNVLEDDCSLSALVEGNGGYLALDDDDRLFQVRDEDGLPGLRRSNNEVITSFKLLLDRASKNITGGGR